MKMLTPHIRKKTFYTKEKIEKQLTKHHPLFLAFCEHFNKVKETLPGMYKTTDYSKFQYLGFKGKIELKRTDDNLFIKMNEEEYSITNEGEIRETMDRIFTDIKKKRRLKNLFDAPKDSFNSFVIKCVAFQENSFVDSFYQSLNEVYNGVEIEEKLWKFDFNDSLSIRSDLFLVKLPEYLFLLDKKNKTIERIENNSEAFISLSQIIQKKTDEMLKEFL